MVREALSERAVARDAESFIIKSEKESRTAATLSVTLSYRKPSIRKDPVTCEFVREDGRWCIDEIRTSG